MVLGQTPIVPFCCGRGLPRDPVLIPSGSKNFASLPCGLQQNPKSRSNCPTRTEKLRSSANVGRSCSDCLSTNKEPWCHLLRGWYDLRSAALIQFKACTMDNPSVSTGSLGLRDREGARIGSCL